MSDLRGLSTPPTIETGNNTAKFVSAFVVSAVAVGAVSYMYVAGHARHPTQQTLAMNDARTAALPSAASRVAPPIGAPAQAPAVIPNPAPEPTIVPPARNDAGAAPEKAARPMRIAHTNSNSFASRPASADSPAADSAQPAPALNTAPEQPAPQDSQTVPAQQSPAQNPLAPTVSQPAPDPNNPQNTDQQNTPPQAPQ